MNLTPVRMNCSVGPILSEGRGNVERFPVMAQVAPGEIRSSLPKAPPENPAPFEDILRDLEEKVVPGLSHWAHPGFFGFFPCNGLLSSVLLLPRGVDG